MLGVLVGSAAPGDLRVPISRRGGLAGSQGGQANPAGGAINPVQESYVGRPGSRLYTSHDRLRKCCLGHWRAHYSHRNRVRSYSTLPLSHRLANDSRDELYLDFKSIVWQDPINLMYRVLIVVQFMELAGHGRLHGACAHR